MNERTATLPAPTLLTCGAAAGPVFVTVTGLQVLTRDGFDLARHPISLLALGDVGWVQTAAFVLAGLLALARAAGMGRHLGAVAGRCVRRRAGARRGVPRRPLPRLPGRVPDPGDAVVALRGARSRSRTRPGRGDRRDRGVTSSLPPLRRDAGHRRVIPPPPG